MTNNKSNTIETLYNEKEDKKLKLNKTLQNASTLYKDNDIIKLLNNKISFKQLTIKYVIYFIVMILVTILVSNVTTKYLMEIVKKKYVENNEYHYEPLHECSDSNITNLWQLFTWIFFRKKTKYYKVIYYWSSDCKYSIEDKKIWDKLKEKYDATDLITKTNKTLPINKMGDKVLLFEDYEKNNDKYEFNISIDDIKIRNRKLPLVVATRNDYKDDSGDSAFQNKIYEIMNSNLSESSFRTFIAGLKL